MIIEEGVIYRRTLPLPMRAKLEHEEGQNSVIGVCVTEETNGYIVWDVNGTRGMGTESFVGYHEEREDALEHAVEKWHKMSR